MSQLGQSRRFDCLPPTSALPRQRTSSVRPGRSVSCQKPTLRVARRWGYSGKTMIAIALATRAGADRG